MRHLLRLPLVLVATLHAPPPASAQDAALLWAASYRAVGRGDTTCVYGAGDCNPCVDDVPAAFDRLAGPPDTRAAFWVNAGEALPPFASSVQPLSWQAHPQGVQRLPLPGDNWVLLSRSTEGGAAGFLIADLDDVDGHAGGAWSVPWARLDYTSYVPQARETVAYYTIPGTTHPGGVQALGRTAYVPVRCDDGEAPCAYVEPDAQACVDGRCPTNGKWDCEAGLCEARHPWVEVVELRSPPSGSRAPEMVPRSVVDLPYDRQGAMYVSAVRMPNGYTLVFVNRGDSGEFDILMSNTVEIGAETDWQLLGRLNFGAFEGWFNDTDNGGLTGDDLLDGLDNEAYQNASLVTECGTGQLYLIGTRQLDGTFSSWRQPNRMDLFRVSIDSRVATPLLPEGLRDPGLVLHWVDDATFDETDACRMRGAAGVQSTADHELVVYCAARTDDFGLFSIGELASF